MKIINLSKAYDAPVISALTLDIKEGGRYALMGASGSGKTTLLRLIAGLEAADAGVIEGVPAQDKIAFLFQEDRLVESLSIRSNLRMLSAAADTELDALLKTFVPEASLSDRISTLSGGMKRRVALMRVLTYPAKLILMDEPFTGLDAETKAAVIRAAEPYLADKTLIFSTHSEDDAALLGAEIIKLNN